MQRFHVRHLAPWVLVLALGVASSATPARAEAPAQEYGIGAACVFANLVYAPAKFLYATGGALVAGAAYLFSGGDLEVARPIVDASLRGDYVITPDHLRGKRPVEFVGRSPAQRDMQRDPWTGDARDPLDEGF